MNVDKYEAIKLIEDIAYQQTKWVFDTIEAHPEESEEGDESVHLEEIKKSACSAMMTVMYLYRSDPEMWEAILKCGGAEVDLEALTLADQANAELREQITG